MRDSIKDSQYFTEYIKEKCDGEKKIEQRVKDGQISEDRIAPLKAMFFMYRMPLILAAYSRGDSIDSLVPQLNEMIVLAKDCWNSEMYEIMLQMISLGVLLEIDDLHFDILKISVEKAGYNDWLLNYLLHSRFDDLSVDGQKNYITSIYDQLPMAANNREMAVQLMKQYLSQWYLNHKDASWFDSHKDTSKHLYYGYWSLEAGAVVKILGLNDTELKDMPHYPYDLVHFKL